MLKFSVVPAPGRNTPDSPTRLRANSSTRAAHVDPRPGDSPLRKVGEYSVIHRLSKTDRPSGYGNIAMHDGNFFGDRGLSRAWKTSARASRTPSGDFQSEGAFDGHLVLGGIVFEPVRQTASGKRFRRVSATRKTSQARAGEEQDFRGS